MIKGVIFMVLVKGKKGYLPPSFHFFIISIICAGDKTLSRLAVLLIYPIFKTISKFLTCSILHSYIKIVFVTGTLSRSSSF